MHEAFDLHHASASHIEDLRYGRVQEKGTTRTLNLVDKTVIYIHTYIYIHI